MIRRPMLSILNSLFEKCAVTVEITGDKLRVSGKGLFGILGVVALVTLIVHFAPQLIALVGGR
jgi:hypothetical protein